MLLCVRINNYNHFDLRLSEVLKELRGAVPIQRHESRPAISKVSFSVGVHRLQSALLKGGFDEVLCIAYGGKEEYMGHGAKLLFRLWKHQAPHSRYLDQTAIDIGTDVCLGWGIPLVKARLDSFDGVAHTMFSVIPSCEGLGSVKLNLPANIFTNPGVVKIYPTWVHLLKTLTPMSWTAFPKCQGTIRKKLKIMFR
jgi:hypothetical protein